MTNPFILNQYLPQETFRGHGAALGGFGMDIANRNAQQARSAEMQEEFKGVMDSNDPKQIAAFSFKYPEAAERAQQSFGIANPNTRGISAMGYGKALQSGDPEQAANKLDFYANQVESAGGKPVNMRSDAEALRNGSMDMNTLEMGVAMTEPELWGRVDKFRKSLEVEAEKGLPAESVAFNDLIQDFTPEQKKTAKLMKAGLKGRAVSNAELSAIESGDIKSYSDYKVKQKQAEKFAEATGSQRAKLIDKGFETITKIDGSVRNIDRAIAALDKGAGVGVFEKMWPSIASASVELDNIRNAMALDVVGATTFGALSAGELALAKDVALPTGLDTKELTEYLGNKKAAQQKLRNYYNEQVQFLDQGGTVAGFLRSKEEGQVQQGGGGQDQQALDWAQANPNDPRAAQIIQKLQGNQ